jgi:hypothetical protein
MTGMAGGLQFKTGMIESDVQGGSNMTGTDCGLFTYKSVPVIFESPYIYI